MSPATLPEATTSAVAINAMEERHWDSVRSIYQAGIDTGHANFASSPPVSWEVCWVHGGAWVR
jgi:L-amino acid N-acyltransferase YncA